MKKTATLTINDRIVTINEITIRQMMTAKDIFTESSILDSVTGLIPLLTDATPEFLLDLAPSELEEIYNKIKEVNASFLKVVPLEKMLSDYRNIVTGTITQALSQLFVKSLPPDMA